MMFLFIIILLTINSKDWVIALTMNNNQLKEKLIKSHRKDIISLPLWKESLLVHQDICRTIRNLFHSSKMVTKVGKFICYKLFTMEPLGKTYDSSEHHLPSIYDFYTSSTPILFETSGLSNYLITSFALTCKNFGNSITPFKIFLYIFVGSTS